MTAHEPAPPQDRDIRSVLHWLESRLRYGAIDNPRTTAELLMEHALGCRRAGLYLHPTELVADESWMLMLDMLRRRLDREPLQYIIGQTEFMSLPFRVDARTLIPRPETELLVETALDTARKSFDPTQPVNIIDIGTGCGNIAVSMAKYLENARVIALDVSEAALEVARQNASLNGVPDQISFTAASIFDCDIDAFQDIQMVVSNPPYVARDDMPALQEEIRDWEPPMAVHDGGDGLRFYPIISELAASWLAPGGSLIVEIGLGQSDAVTGMFRERGFTGLRVLPDLHHIFRVVTGLKH